MGTDTLVSKYLKINNILLADLNSKSKIVNVFDGEKNQTFSFKDFFYFIANYFDLIPDFIEKAVIIVENLNANSDNLIEIGAEYKKTNGKPVSFTYHVFKQSDDDFLISIQEETIQIVDQLDQMTKTNSKAYFESRIKTKLLTKTSFLLIYVDIDNFKHINDEYGKLIGDMILIEMVTNIKNFIGNKGIITRIGGDRFLVAYDISDDYDEVHDFLFDFKQAIQKLSVNISRGVKITTTIASVRYPLDGDSYELLMRKCEKALIRGKNKGRDCFIMYLEEKCGKVTLEDKIEDIIVKIDDNSTKNNIYSLITNINQLLSNENAFDEAIDKSLSLIGNYFYIDRVSVARLNIKNNLIAKHHIWYNPKISIKYETYCNNEIIPFWAEALGQKKYIKIDDVKSISNDYPLKDLFPIDHTTASLAFELIVNGRSFGLIRYDMTTGVRHWQPEDLQVFMLISQLLASYLQKNYLRDTNYSTLYLDPKYNCQNFTKVFKDAGEYIINNNNIDYAIMELDIKDIINYRTIIGEKRMAELISSIVKAIKKYDDLIYGKKNGGAFIIFVKNHNKDLIEKIHNDINKVLQDFSAGNHFNELISQTGVYLANSKEDRLIDAIGYANLTRTLNKSNDILYYSNEIKNEALFKTEMILRIDEALENDEFLLYLQPKISTTDGSLVGAEALTRWKYKGEKLLFPDKFIHIFEEQGVIEKLDFSVFESVCKYQQMLLKSKQKPVPISVNVSRYVSNFEGYIKTLEQIRKMYDIDPSLIEIEITEGMYFENSDIISTFIEKLHNFGYKVSMDDFGAGYSNLVSMAKLNFDTIKFDRSFCMDLDNNNVKIMLDKLIELIKTMKMKTICEGVETKENVEYLTYIGCDSIQGYYYSKPIPYQDFYKKYYTE